MSEAPEGLALVVCTYRRPRAVRRLLVALESQVLAPDRVLVVDASPDEETRRVVEALAGGSGSRLEYCLAPPGERGLTRQRNLGIAGTDEPLVAFLDDDTVPSPEYFAELVAALRRDPGLVGVGGRIRDGLWRERGGVWIRPEGLRWSLRRRLGLDSPAPAGRMTDRGHPRPLSFLPPDGRDHEVDFVMGGASLWRRSLLERVPFSRWFEGYGLYEDMDFSLRARRHGRLLFVGAAVLDHLHEPAGRPPAFRYGRMVVRNGWRVWRQWARHPPARARLHWWAVTLLLAGIRVGDAVRGPGRGGALAEAAGRMVAVAEVLVRPPRPTGDGEA